MTGSANPEGAPTSGAHGPLPDPPREGEPLTSTLSGQPGRGSRLRGKLFRKYVGLFVAVVCVALIANGAFEIAFSYQEHRTSLVRIQREQAEAAAAKVGQFINDLDVEERLCAGDRLRGWAYRTRTLMCRENIHLFEK
jgi:hypothetical protein